MATRLDLAEADFRQLVRHMGQVMDDMLQHGLMGFHFQRMWRPAVNVYEAADRYVVCVDLAGMDRQQIEVRTEGDRLTISGTRAGPSPAAASGELRVHVMEIDEGPFRRELQIAEEVDRSRITARYANGYLWIELPKRS